MQILNNHGCDPINVPYGPIATSFTYDCRCGKLMLVERCALSDTIIHGTDFVMTLPDGTEVTPDYIDI